MINTIHCNLPSTFVIFAEHLFSTTLVLVFKHLSYDKVLLKVLETVLLVLCTGAYSHTDYMLFHGSSHTCTVKYLECTF